MKSKIIILIIVVLVILGGLHLLKGKDYKTDVVETETETETMPTDGEAPVAFIIEGTLPDVTDGEEVRGVRTLPTTTGIARAGFNDGTYLMEAVFTDLPDPVGDDFYEGWVVRRGDDFSVISTGMLEKEGEGEYSNVFTSDQDLLDHDFYVLTLEPNDGDPAPADHILEGVME